MIALIVIAVTASSAPVGTIIVSAAFQSIIITLMYATEATSRSRFISQLHSARLQAELDINTLKSEHQTKSRDSDNKGNVFMLFPFH
jgi:hypothetical protein